MPLRIVAPAAALLVFLALSALSLFGGHAAYQAIITHWGVERFPSGLAFGDMAGLVAARQCDRLGIDVVIADPCDVLHRPFNYSPLWLLASRLGPGPGATTLAGWLAGLSFLLCLFLLPPPRRLSELPALILATLSTMVVFAVERANPDLIIFMIALAAGYLALVSSRARFLGYGAALFAGLLKYYPLTLLLLTLRERISTFFRLNAAALCLILAFAAIYRSEIERGLPTIASGIYYGDMFAAQNLPFGLAETLEGAAGRHHALGLALYAVFFLLCAANSARLALRGEIDRSLARLAPPESIFLAIGGILIIGCFFAGQNVGYRGIFLLFVLPGLLALARNAAGKGTERLAKALSRVVLVLMWGEFFRTNMIFALRGSGFGETAILAAWLGFWLLRELAWWWSISVLVALVLGLLRQSESARWLSSSFARRAALPDPAGPAT
jgi:hypothetical protein